VYSRKIVGWAIDTRQTTNLVLNALDMAIEARKPTDTVIHSDHGTQFTSWAFTSRIRDAGLVGSMGTTGDFEYIEVYYNRSRRHSALQWDSPTAFEAKGHHRKISA
jgi:transposase InsO family protein